MNLTGANLLLIWSNKQNCLPHLGVYFYHSTVPVLNLPLQDYISNTIIMNYNHVLRTHLHFLYSPPPLKLAEVVRYFGPINETGLDKRQLMMIEMVPPLNTPPLPPSYLSFQTIFFSLWWKWIRHYHVRFDLCCI